MAAVSEGCAYPKLTQECIARLRGAFSGSKFSDLTVGVYTPPALDMFFDPPEEYSANLSRGYPLCVSDLDDRGMPMGSLKSEMDFERRLELLIKRIDGLADGLKVGAHVVLTSEDKGQKPWVMNFYFPGVDIWESPEGICFRGLYKRVDALASRLSSVV
jgi:hypothetical protein